MISLGCAQKDALVRNGIAGKDSTVELGDLARDCDLFPHRLSSHPVDEEAALVALAGGCVNGHEPRRAAARLSDVREPC